MQEMMKAMMRQQGGDQFDMEEMQREYEPDRSCSRFLQVQTTGMMAQMGGGMGGLGGLGGGMPNMADMFKMMGMGGPGR